MGLFTGRRRWLLPPIVLLFLIYYLLPSGGYDYVQDRFRGRHEIKAFEFPKIPLSPKDSNGFLSVPIAQPYCTAHNFELFTPRNTRRKVYDLFMVNTELEWLEIRLNELKNHVDYFVILESPRTFTGMEKPLHVKENWARFKEFHSKIILRVLDDSALESTITWDHEDLQRNAMFDQILSPHAQGYSKLLPAQAPQPDDVILVSDIDEIPKPASLTLLRNCAFPPRLTLRSQFYYYSFQFLHRGPQWAHPQATVYAGNDTIRPADLRNGEGSYGGRNKLTLHLDEGDLWNSSWHCSTCFSTIEEVLKKMESFSHTKLNQPEFRSPDHVVNRVRNGLDLFDRPGEFYDKVPGRNWDIPSFLVSVTESSEAGWSWLQPSTYAGIVKGDKKVLKGGEGLKGGRFEYLLNRDPENANFKDYSIVDAIAGVIAAEAEKSKAGNVGSALSAKVHEGVKGGAGIDPENIVLLGAEEAKKAEAERKEKERLEKEKADKEEKERQDIAAKEAKEKADS